MVAAGFALAGMLTGGLMQTDVVAYETAFGLNHEQVSFWLSLFSVGTALGGGVAGWLSDVWGAGRIYRACMGLSGAGLAAFACGHAASNAFGFTASALGVGGLIVGNILVSNDETDTPCRSLNHLHASHGFARLIGVFLSIFVLSLFWQLSYLILGIAFVALAVFYSPRRGSGLSRPAETAKTPANSAGKMLWPVGLAFLLYMTAEMVLITWLPAYFEKDLQWGAGSSKAIYGFFLAGLIAGRLVGAKFWPRELSSLACRFLMAVHAAAVAVFLWAGHPAALGAALFAAGFCEGPGWPALFAFAMRRSAGMEGKVTSVIYVVCCAAIVLATAGSGMLAERRGLESVFYVVGVAHLLFSLLFDWLLLSKPLIR